MNNLLLYVEENLVLSPEICYETESSIPHNCSTESTKESINMPLVLPQSTLEDTYFKTTPKLTLTEGPQNLTRTDEANTQDQVPQDNTYTPTKNYTNPFLQNTPAYNEADLSPKRLMQLWTENLQLQMQITTTLGILFSKVLNNSAKSENDNLVNDENVNTSNTFLCINDNILSTSSANTNIFSTCHDTTFPDANTYNENLNVSTHSNPFQVSSIQNAINNCTKEARKTVRVPPGYEKHHNRFMLNENCFTNNRNTCLTTSDKYLNDDKPLRETNPFKLSLAGKLNISDSREDNCSNSICLPSTVPESQNLISDYDSILKRFVERDNSKMQASTEASLDNAYKDTLYSRPQFNITSDNTSSIQTESFVSDTKSLPSQCHWNVDNVNHRISRMDINGQNIQHPGQLPTNNLEYNSTLISNTNFNEGYSTHASTSQNLYTSSPLLQMNNKTECSQPLLSENANKNADLWVKAFENSAHLNDWNKVAYLSQRSDQTMTSSKNQSYQSTNNLDKGMIAESPINDNNISTHDLPRQEKQLQKIVGCVSSEHVIFFQVFELPKTVVHIFHHQGEGWLLTDEFVQGFTKFQSTSYAILLLYMLNIPVRYMNVDITNYAVKFINIDSTVSKTIEDTIHNNTNIHLIQLKSVIEILNKLEIISEKDANHALTNDSVIQDIWLINNAYKNLKYRIEITE